MARPPAEAVTTPHPGIDAPCCIYGTGAFRCRRQHRPQRRPQPVAEVPDLPDDIDPEALVVADDEVREVLLRLSARDRQVLLLHAWEGLDGDALAGLTGFEFQMAVQRHPYGCIFGNRDLYCHHVSLT